MTSDRLQSDEPVRDQRSKLRFITALVALALGLVSISDAMANFIVKADPRAALSLAPWNGTVAADAAQEAFSATPTSAKQSMPARLAVRALRIDPTAVKALIVLGSQARLRGETERSQRLFAHALSMSRRELPAQLWAIEEAVSRGDIANALMHYDLALRTSRRALELLYPTLAAAIEEPRVRAELLSILKSEPVWTKTFVNFITESGVNPTASVALLTDPAAGHLPVEDINRTSLVNSLAMSGDLRGAWDYYSTFRTASRSQSRDGNFRANIERPSVFDWSPQESPGVSAVIQADEEGGRFEFFASPSVGGVVLKQAQFLQPGRYTFKVVMEIDNQPAKYSPYWELNCQSGTEIWRSATQKEEAQNKTTYTELSVPNDCPFQDLVFVVRPSDAIAGSSGRIISAEIIS